VNTSYAPPTLHLNPWLGMGIELSALSLLMVAIHFYAHARHLAPETSRKLFHLGGGLTTLALPWMFTDVWPVLLLTIVTVPALLALKHVQRLRSGLGDVLYGVTRPSLGEVYFPLSACLLFALAHDRPLLYIVPLLLLTLADPAAAIIGSRFGSLQYVTRDGHKSLEGSLAFFTVAFFGTAGALLLAGPTPNVAVPGVGLTLALLLTLVEAISWRGLDNLLIPITGFVFLESLLASNLVALLVSVLLIAAILGVIMMYWGQPLRAGSSRRPGAI
jgi:phytol kinase